MSTLRLALVLLMLSFNALAAEHKLIDITNDVDNEKAHFSAILDKKSDVVKFVQAGFLNGKQLYRYTYVANQAYNGITLYKTQGRNVVDLKSSNLTSYNGGHLSISYLYNGITGSRRGMEMELVRNGDTWEVQHKGRTVKRLHFVSNRKPLVGAIGVKYIKFIYK
jgi:hypothetical protein